MDGEGASETGALVIGLTGGIASGKSRVSRLLAERGALVLDADALAHAELARPAVRDAIVEAFGPEVLDRSGAIDRAALGRRVFGDPAARARLEAIVHPGVLAAIQAAIVGARRAPGTRRAAVVLDVPLLVETGMTGACDEVLFVDASPGVRAARAAARGWAEDEIARREAHQRPLAEKRAAATFVIDNDGDLDATAAQVDRFWRERVEPEIR